MRESDEPPGNESHSERLGRAELRGRGGRGPPPSVPRRPERPRGRRRDHDAGGRCREQPRATRLLFGRADPHDPRSHGTDVAKDCGSRGVPPETTSSRTRASSPAGERLSKRRTTSERGGGQGSPQRRASTRRRMPVAIPSTSAGRQSNAFPAAARGPARPRPERRQDRAPRRQVLVRLSRHRPLRAERTSTSARSGSRFAISWAAKR